MGLPGWGERGAPAAAFVLFDFFIFYFFLISFLNYYYDFFFGAFFFPFRFAAGLSERRKGSPGEAGVARRCEGRGAVLARGHKGRRGVPGAAGCHGPLRGRGASGHSARPAAGGEPASSALVFPFFSFRRAAGDQK